MVCLIVQSIPYVWLSKIIRIFDLNTQCIIPGELAQLGERLLCTQEVIGSIPLFSTISCVLHESLKLMYF